MTNFEKLVVSACTGTIMTDKNALLEFAEITLGRTIPETELKNELFWKEIKGNLAGVFSSICKSKAPDLEISLEDDSVMAFYPLLEAINEHGKRTAEFAMLL